jgi:hypothetical protein
MKSKEEVLEGIKIRVQFLRLRMEISPTLETIILKEADFAYDAGYEAKKGYKGDCQCENCKEVRENKKTRLSRK